MGLPFMTSDQRKKKEEDDWCREHIPNWCKGIPIIDMNGHVIKNANNNVDDNMIPYINEDGGKQLYKVGRNLRQGGPQPRSQPLPQGRGSSGHIRTRRGIKLGLASPDILQQFAKKNCIDYLIAACLYIFFAFNTPFKVCTFFRQRLIFQIHFIFFDWGGVRTQSLCST
jgi:hypothetical protein